MKHILPLLPKITAAIKAARVGEVIEVSASA